MPLWLQHFLDTLTNASMWRAFRHVFAFNLMQDGGTYLACVVLVWGLLHVVLRKRLAHRLITTWPSRADLRREITYSFSSLLVVAAGGAVMLAMVVSGVAEIYADPLQHGWPWLLASLPVAIVLHDAYFYWTHRLMHTRWLFRHVHVVHHRSRHPSPWAALSFHPLEALVQGAPLPLLCCCCPRCTSGCGRLPAAPDAAQRVRP